MSSSRHEIIVRAGQLKEGKNGSKLVDGLGRKIILKFKIQLDINQEEKIE